MLLGWLGELLRMVEVVLLFWMALVPSLGRELVECCLELMIWMLVVTEGGGGLGESSESLARA